MPYLSVDVETGGLGLETSLLSIGLVLADDNFQVLLEKELFVKPDNKLYCLQAEGMTVNKIDIVEHDKKAISYRDANNFLRVQLHNWSAQGKNKLTVVGKQVRSDLMQIWDKVLKREAWENFCSHRLIDISSVFMFLRDLGKYPKDMKGGLADLLNYHRLATDGQHNALWDARMTLFVYQRMLLLAKDKHEKML